MWADPGQALLYLASTHCLGRREHSTTRSIPDRRTRSPDRESARIRRHVALDEKAPLGRERDTMFVRTVLPADLHRCRSQRVGNPGASFTIPAPTPQSGLVLPPRSQSAACCVACSFLPRCFRRRSTNLTIFAKQFSHTLTGNSQPQEYRDWLCLWNLDLLPSLKREHVPVSDIGPYYRVDSSLPILELSIPKQIEWDERPALTGTAICVCIPGSLQFKDLV